MSKALDIEEQRLHEQIQRATRKANAVLRKARARAPKVAEGAPEPAQTAGHRYVVVPHAEVRDELRAAAYRYISKASHRCRPFSRAPVIKFFRPARPGEQANVRYSHRAELDETGIAGCANLQEDAIYLKATLPTPQAIRVLYHEVFHLRGGSRALDESWAERWASENAPY